VSEITEKDTKASQAVDQFDQLGTAPGEGDSETPAGLPDESGKPGSGISMIMMDQWLEQIEGDPSYLLKNQFMIEERLELDRRGRMVMETRPW
jgi:Ca-activated chloride channel homolog